MLIEDIHDLIKAAVLEGLSNCLLILSDSDANQIRFARVYLTSLASILFTSGEIILSKTNTIHMGNTRGLAEQSPIKPYLNQIEKKEEEGKTLMLIARAFREINLTSLFVEVTRELGIEQLRVDDSDTAFKL